MNSFADIEVFTRVVDLGGFTRAAASLGLTPSGVSRIVSRLEERLGARLLNYLTLCAGRSLSVHLERSDIPVKHIKIGGLRRAHAVHPVAALQTEYSLWTRDPEAELLAQDEPAVHRRQLPPQCAQKPPGKWVESRAPDSPPARDAPIIESGFHAQIPQTTRRDEARGCPHDHHDHPVASG